jgi:hypothetical protein
VLSHPIISQWFDNSKEPWEIRCRIASLVQHWSAAPDASPAEVVDEWAEELLENLLIEAPVVQRYGLLFGLAIDEYCDLGNGIAVRPIDADGLRELLLGSGATVDAWLRLPSQPSILAVVHLAAARTTLGALVE